MSDEGGRSSALSVVRGYEEGGFLVMADPEGNAFCLLPSSEWVLDDDGTAHYQHPPGLRHARNPGRGALLH
jgi:hypothetical protein